MDDGQIIARFWAREESAIYEAHAAYGQRLYQLSDRILRCREDAEECVNDTYLRAWESIPPQRPQYLFAYLAKICRNLSLDRLQWLAAAKRNAQILSLTEEMEQAIPNRAGQWQLEQAELGELLNGFLNGLPLESRLIFLRRYWYFDSISEISLRYGMTQSKVKTRLHRTRNQLKNYLEQEGIHV